MYCKSVVILVLTKKNQNTKKPQKKPQQPKKIHKIAKLNFVLPSENLSKNSSNELHLGQVDCN